jgi:hypothetical protein
VFAAMARRIRAAVASTDTALPSLVAYNYAECVNSEPLPFLFQRTAGRGLKGTTRPMHKTYVARVLNKVARAAKLTGPDGKLIDFTPHDFRRVFATDALAAGLPPHIIQKLMGHATLATTQGYAAIFPDDIIRSHRAFIENRRSLRPADEYRAVTAEEWREFEEHFAKRKLAIGDCMRAYGTACVHEYACEQCGLARPDPGPNPDCNAPATGSLSSSTKLASAAGSARSNDSTTSWLQSTTSSTRSVAPLAGSASSWSPCRRRGVRISGRGRTGRRRSRRTRRGCRHTTPG